MNDIELANKINASMQETHERCMKLIEDGHAKDKEIAELKASNERLRSAGLRCYGALDIQYDDDEELEIFNETPAQSLQKLKEKS
jgi:hypothetical protein